MCIYILYYRIITTVERDTGKYHEFIAGIVYECAARVNNAGGNELVMFPRYRVLYTVVIMLLSYANAKNDWSRTKPHPLETKSIATTDFLKRTAKLRTRRVVRNDSKRISEKHSELALERAWGVHKEEDA